MTDREISDWIRGWMSTHPKCKELNSMYEDFIEYDEMSHTYENVGQLTELIWKLNPLKYMSYVADGMFFECEYLTSMVIPDNIKSIGNFAFNGCSHLSSVMIGRGVTSIGRCAFYYCDRLTSITIPDSVTTIGDQAFEECSKLTRVIIGNNVTDIGEAAFAYCYRLTTVTIPSSVTNIGEYAFEGCKNLQITYEGTKQQWENLVSGKTIFANTDYVCNCSDGAMHL